MFSADSSKIKSDFRFLGVGYLDRTSSDIWMNRFGTLPNTITLCMSDELIPYNRASWYCPVSVL